MPDFGDARAEVLAILQSSGLTATISGHLAVDSTGNVTTPYIWVVSDGVPDAVWPIVERVTIRCVCYGGAEDTSHDLAQATMNFLLSTSGTGQHLKGCHFLTGPLAANDPQTGQPLSSFTIRAEMQAS